MKLTRFFLFTFIALLLVGSVSAFFPAYHYDVTVRACNTYTGTNNLANQCCTNYLDYLTAGANLADITVVSYLEKMGAYDATHSWDYCRALSGIPGPIEQQCFALGNCLHLIQDTPSHNDIVPNAIRRTLMPNLVIHAPAEYKFDRWARRNGADYLAMQRSLNIARCNRYSPQEPNYDPHLETMPCKIINSMQIALSSTPGGSNVDAYALSYWYIKSVVTDESVNQGVYTAGTGAYINAFPTGYKVALVMILLFFTSAAIAMLKMQKRGLFVKIFFGVTIVIWLLTIIGVVAILTDQIYNFFLAVIYPISVIAPIGNPAVYDSVIITNTHNFFDYGEAYIPQMVSGKSGLCSSPPCTPSGFNQGGIQRTDRVISIIWIFILIGLLGMFIFMTAKTFGIDIFNVQFRRRRGKR